MKRSDLFPNLRRCIQEADNWIDTTPAERELQTLERLARAAEWFNEFVAEPPDFPNEGDRVYWNEQLQAHRAALAECLKEAK